MASDDIWILGIHMTKFGKHPDQDIVDLASEAVLGALADGGVTMKDMGVMAAGNLMAANAGIGQQLQKQIGQTGIPVYNVANACATGATALRIASWRSRRARPTWAWPSGSRSWPGPACSRAAAAGRTRGTWTPSGRYGAVAAVDGRIGTETMPGVFAQIGMEYGHRYGGTSFELFARICEKNHAHSTLNPLAAYQKRMTLEQIMGDVMIAYPNTRPMCSANCDGAAAAVVVSGAKLKTLSPGAAAAGGQDLGLGAHHRPLGGGLPGPPRRQHPDPQRRHPGLRAGRRRTRGPRPGRAARLLRHRRARPLRQPDALRGGRGGRLLQLRGHLARRHARRSTCPAASSPRATRSPPPASPTSGRWPPTCGARPATARSKAPGSAWPTSSASARPAACTSWRRRRLNRGPTRSPGTGLPPDPDPATRTDRSGSRRVTSNPPWRRPRAGSIGVVAPDRVVEPPLVVRRPPLKLCIDQ